ncbi:MAG: PEP-CTERM sorting domain-containing protein [Phycisphaeraceae bacterium]|nr:PEP-CTERM sorting domain-containing protein [Phycisphaeraceae bacterium]
MRHLARMFVAALMAGLFCGSLHATPIQTTIAIDQAITGASKPYSVFQEERPQTWPWKFFMHPAVTDPLQRGWAFPERGYNNCTPQVLGQILGVGSVNNIGVYVIYDMLVQELVPHLLYLDRGDLIAREERPWLPERQYPKFIGALAPQTEARLLPLSVPQPQPVPEPATMGLLTLGVWALLGRRPARRRA